MTQADKNFIDTCKTILESGISSEGTEVRTKWQDGQPAHYISIVGVQNVYGLEKEFPMITLRNNSETVKRSIDEMLWIWQKKSNNINELNSHIWDQWADENGSIGKAYGYQMGEKFLIKTKEGIIQLDQTDFVLYLLKNEPASRRIMTNIFVHKDLKDMRLEPCVYATHWLVKGDKLNLILSQRSQDMLVANGWNTMQYAALTHMMAHVNGLKPGMMIHNIDDCHIYDRHIPMVEELIKAKPVECSPKLTLNTNTKDFYSIKLEDFEISGYDYNKEIKLPKIPVAI